MKRAVILIVIFTAILHFAAIAESRPKHLKISMADHPHAKTFSKVIQDSYAELGYTVKFYPMPVERGLIELNKGNFDADVLRLVDVTKRFEDIRSLAGFTLDVEWTLLCQKGLSCNQQVLRDPQVDIVVPHAQKNMLDAMLAGQTSAKFHPIDVTLAPLDMLKAERFQYAVYPFLAGDIPVDVRRYANVFVIKIVKASHFVHRRHAGLIPALTQAINRRIHQKTVEIE